MKVIFETDHLIVRRFQREDAERLYLNHLEGEVRKWIPNESYADEAEALDAIGFFMDCVDGERLPYVLAVESKDTHELIGDIGVNEVEGKSGQVEIGYTISKGSSGRGYATEAVRAMTGLIAEKFSADTVYGRVMKGNDASVRVLEKNGYVFDSVEYGAEDDPWGNGMLVYVKKVSGS